MLIGRREGIRPEIGHFFSKILHVFQYFCLGRITNFDFFLNVQGNTRFSNNPSSFSCLPLLEQAKYGPSLRSLPCPLPVPGMLKMCECLTTGHARALCTYSLTIWKETPLP